MHQLLVVTNSACGSERESELQSTQLPPQLLQLGISPRDRWIVQKRVQFGDESTHLGFAEPHLGGDPGDECSR